MKRKPTYDEMLLRMAGLCAGSEQCASDIRTKILKNEFSVSQADAMLEYLTRNKYIDDVRFAKAYASDKVRFSGWGKLKIRLGLRAKGLSDSVISKGLAHISPQDYAEAIEKALTAKARSLDMSDIRDRQKLYRQLASRGFESSVIVPAIRRYVDSLREE